MKLTAQEVEWLEYAVAHMLDDTEPEDTECAAVLQGLLDRAPTEEGDAELHTCPSCFHVHQVP